MAGYDAAKLVKTFGGEDATDSDENYLMSQTHHVVADDNTIYVSMMLNRTIRSINAADGSLNKDIGGDDSDFSNELEMGSGMCFHGNDEIIITDNNGNKVQIRKKDGTYVKTFGEGFDSPVCAAVGDGKIFIGQVGDSAKKVIGFDASTLEEVCAITTAGEKQITGVNYIAYDSVNNKLVLSDTDGGAVHVFSSCCKYELTIGESGEEPGQFDNPTGVATDNEGNILIGDMTNCRVQVFDGTGKFVSVLGGGEFSTPMDVFVRGDGSVYVVDGSVFMGYSRVQVFNK